MTHKLGPPDEKIKWNNIKLLVTLEELEFKIKLERERHRQHEN